MKAPVYLLFLLVGGSPACENHPAPAARPKKTMHTTDPPALDASWRLQSAGDLLRYQVGTPTFHGRTTVEVRGDGRASVRWERGKSDDRYQRTLGPAELLPLHQLLSHHPYREMKSSRTTAVPGETRIVLTYQPAGGKEQVVEMWDNEQWDVPALRDLVVAFNHIASTVSGGKVTY